MRRVCLVLMLAAGTAVAQPAEPPTATKLFEQGRDFAKQGKYPDACDAFARSYALDKAVGTELNLADCQEHLGHLAEAWRLFSDGATHSADNPKRQKFAADRASNLAAKLAIVIVRLADPKNASVTIAGHPETAAPEINERVEPGSIEVRVTSPLRSDYVSTQTAIAGATLTFEVAAATAPVAPDPTERRPSRVLIGYSLGGLGLASLAGGVLVGLVARSHYNSEVNSGNCVKLSTGLTCNAVGFGDVTRAGTLANAGTVLGVAGVAMLASGAIVFLTAPRDVVVTPVATRESVGVAVSASF